MKKKRRRVRTRIKVIGVLLLGYILFFAFTSIYYRDKWYPNTTVNSIDVSNLTYNESKEEIANRVNNYQLEIIGKNDISFKINGKDIDLKATYEKNLEKSFSNHLDDRSLFGIFANHDYEVNLKITYNQDKLEKIINNSVLVNGSDDYKIEESIPDHVEYDEKTQTGKIVEGVNGNKLDIDEFKTIIKGALKDVQTKIDLTDKEAYPDVYEKSTNKNIEKQLSTYNSYLLNWITWDMGEGVTETITPNDIKDWLIIGDSGKVTLDKDEMSEWIEDFCLKYKTVGKTRHFTTHTGQVIEPTYSNKAYQKDYENFENDWDTQNYSEIDLTEQRVYVYRDGQLAYSCICVSGLPTEKQDRITRTGVWYIKEKRLEKVLVGEDYETPVKYWIRIMWTGTGYHALNRSDWDKWTPDLYKTKGSHGCLNLKEEDAKKLYELINSGDPVFIHY